MSVYAIIPAAGIGARMGGEIPKQYAMLGDKPILAHTLEVFENCRFVQGIIIVVAPSYEVYCRAEIIEKYNFKKVLNIVRGGIERQDSVYNGLKEISGAEIVVVHDAVRPFLPPKLLEVSIKEAFRWGASAPVLPLVDTIKSVDEDEFSTGTLDRRNLRAVQTPQVFRYHILLSAMERAIHDGLKDTDESATVERTGHRVKLIEGSPVNIKVTTPYDLALAEAILRLDIREI